MRVKAGPAAADARTVGRGAGRPGGGPSRPVLAGILLAAVTACVVTVLGLQGWAVAFPAGALASGAVAVAGGTAVAVRGLREDVGGRFRVLLGGAALVWGAGQVLLAVLVWLGVASFPTVGDLLAAGAAPLAIAGLVLLPRRTAQPWRGARLACEALMVGAAAAALLWHAWFRQVLLPDLAVADVVAVLVIVADLSVLALVLICFAQELDAGLGATLVGVALYVAADLVTLYAVVPGGPWPWSAAALACAAWPLICTGLLRVSAEPPDLPAQDMPRAESRRLLTVSGVVLALFVGFFTSLLVTGGTVDPVTVALPALVVAANAGREVVASRQNARLLEHFVGQAQRDALTGLSNRWALTERLVALRSRPRPISVLTLDLDGFKEVNGLLGHSVGDALLAAVARCLEAACPRRAGVYRLGGDEFAVLLDADEEEACRLADALRGAVTEAARQVPGVARVPLAVSVGVAAAAPWTGGPDPLRALAHSALALRRAKQSGRNRVERYSPDVDAADRRRALVEARLRVALAADAIDVHFQPVVELDSGRLVGLEALARWHDPQLGPVGPEEFVAVAESAGLIIELGDLVLHRAITAAADSGASAAGVNVAVNASPLQLRVPGFAAAVAAALHASGVAPERFVLEVTESTCVSERDPGVEVLRDLAAMGVKVALDDFGTGYSALGYLDRLPVHIVKLDRCLVQRFAEPRSLAVARGIVDLSTVLGLDVVVEGVETVEQERAARRLGARYGQGWRWSAPVPAHEIPALLRAAAPVASLQR